MTSTAKWIAQCISQEASCSRRSSLNQIDLVEQLSRLSSTPSFLAHQTRLNGLSESNLLNVYDDESEEYSSGRPSEDGQSQGLTHDDGRPLLAPLSLRRASCDPRLLQETLLTPRHSILRSGLRRASLATPSGRRSSALLIAASELPRRKSLGGPSPLQPAWEISPRQPSLSPCVEDELKEERFLFSNFDKKIVPIEGASTGRSDTKSSCSPFLHNENFSKWCASVDTRGSPIEDNMESIQRKASFSENGRQNFRASVCPKKLQEASTTAHFIFENPNRKRNSIPAINIEEPTPDNRKVDPEPHEGFSQWLIQHVRESCASSLDYIPDQEYADVPDVASRWTPQQQNGFTHHDRGTSVHSVEGVARGEGDILYRPSCRGLRRVSLPYRRNAFSTSGCRRVSLQSARGWEAVTSRRKASLHTPRLRIFAPSTLSPLPCPKRSPLRLGAVIGRGGFGTVHVGRYRDSYVAVKKVIPRRSGSCLANEKISLRVGGPHPHLVTTLALLAPGHCPTSARLMQFDPETDTVIEKEVGLKTAMQEFGLYGCPANNTPVSIRQLDSTKSGSPRLASLSRLGQEKITSVCLREDRSWLWVVSELCTATTLLSIIHSSVELSIKRKLRYLGELASGLSFLHSRGFVHRDVKPANAFIAYSGELKLGDYGCCGQLGDDMTPVIGTIPYQAPEVLQGSVGCINSDVFSFGVTAWHLIHRSIPYLGLHPHVVAYNVTRVGLRPDACWATSTRQEDEPSLLEALLGALCRRCWEAEPRHRPSSTSICRSISLLYLTPEVPKRNSLVALHQVS